MKIFLPRTSDHHWGWSPRKMSGSNFTNAFASGISGATPKLAAGIGATPGAAEHHRFTTR
jgi:hypothetical protein